MRVKIFDGFSDDDNVTVTDAVASSTSIQLPSKPVCRLVGHDDNAPITIVRFTCKSIYNISKKKSTIYLDDEKTFSRLDRTVITVLTTSLKILI